MIKVGDKVICTNKGSTAYNYVGIVEAVFESHCNVNYGSTRGYMLCSDLKLYYGDEKTSDGGPSDYYDFPSSWNTLNDYIEYKSDKQWGVDSFHWGNVTKALCRWGDKSGTSLPYDAKKVIYSACRVLARLSGKEKLRKYLQELLDDPQFKGDPHA